MRIIHPASGAIIMALGIFLYAAVEAFPFLDQVLGGTLAIVLVILSVIVYIFLTRQFFQKDFLYPLLRHPVRSFALGTWVAGISVLCNVLIKYFPTSSSIVVQVMAVINTFFWILFFLCCIYNFKQLLHCPTKYPVHGVILLSTVATQSIIIVWTESFPLLSHAMMMAAIGVGLVFYICGIWLLGLRYKRRKQWSLVEDWTNTNCIIHGALSITGLAIVTLQLLSASTMMFFWLIVFSLLIVVEGIELARAVLRVRKLGWKKGIFTYNVSQWSRNFTFGMFYAFTMMMHENSRYNSVFYDFHTSFLAVWAWVVLVVLLAEVGLWGMSVIQHSFVYRQSIK